MMQTVIRFAEYWRLKKLNTSYFRFLFDFGSTWRVLRVPVVKLQKGCLGFAVALSTCNKVGCSENYHYYFSSNKCGDIFYLIQPPDVAVLVLLVFALDDLHLVLHRFLVEDGADKVGDKPETFLI